MVVVLNGRGNLFRVNPNLAAYVSWPPGVTGASNQLEFVKAEYTD